MMRKLLLVMFVLVGIGMNAQTTHNLDWFIGISETAASLTIDEGDTVIWTFTDNAPHTVTSDSGSTETFNSKQQSGGTFSYKFTQVGTNPYHCIVHPSMVGTITVEALGVDESSMRAFTMVPNPATSKIVVELPTQIENLNVRVFDMAGRILYDQPLKEIQLSIDVSSLGAGVYMIELSNRKVSKTKRFIKK